MTTQPADLALLAGKLTEAQRAHLTSPMRDIGNPAVWFLCSDDAVAKRNLPTRVVLTRKGLLEVGHRFGPTVLTPLGLALRNHLQENSNG